MAGDDEGDPRSRKAQGEDLGETFYDAITRLAHEPEHVTIAKLKKAFMDVSTTLPDNVLPFKRPIK